MTVLNGPQSYFMAYFYHILSRIIQQIWLSWLAWHSKFLWFQVQQDAYSAEHSNQTLKSIFSLGSMPCQFMSESSEIPEVFFLGWKVSIGYFTPSLGFLLEFLIVGLYLRS
ncbi:hypothetical protein O6H91_04G141000 [Diphasiastrum complanatum]|uniref:Uncharacterized protein n=1 Tax=Diphasiastrum complanatum TaxID=34168 RepID=A0ACC2E2H2_DIPCM|nr:hypothetical protein O6H91_04G141000 [Diphasiastrum complanatum]